MVEIYRTPYRSDNAQWPAIRIGLCVAVLALLSVILIAPPIYVAPIVAIVFATAATLRWPVVGICLLAIAVPWGGGFSATGSSVPITLPDVLIASIGAAWIVSAVWSRSNPISTTVWTPFVALFIIAIALSATQATDSRASLRELVKWVEMLVVFLAATRFVHTRRQVQLVVAALVAGGVSQALLGYIQFGFQLGPTAFMHGNFLRAYGTFDQPNPYAGYLNMTLPLALATGFFARTKGEQGLYLSASVLIFGALLASESRGALLAGLLAIVVVGACANTPIRRLVWIAVLLTCMGAWLAAVGVVPVSPFARLLGAIGLGGVSFGNVTDANFSAVERAAHWLAGLRMFAQHPILGVGIGNYASAYPAYHPRGWYAALAHAHNYYINISAEAGVIGLTAYLLLVGSALWYSYAAVRWCRNSPYFPVVLGVLGALVATDFHNLFDVLYVHGMVALLGVLMALVPISLRGIGASPFPFEDALA